jgi:hypothetical protein
MILMLHIEAMTTYCVARRNFSPDPKDEEYIMRRRRGEGR